MFSSTPFVRDHICIFIFYLYFYFCLLSETRFSVILMIYWFLHLLYLLTFVHSMILKRWAYELSSEYTHTKEERNQQMGIRYAHCY